MINRLHLFLVSFIFCYSFYSQNFQQAFVASDLVNFYKAYDKISLLKDSIKQQQVLQNIYLRNASTGLKSLIAARNYTEKDYLTWMTQYPKFWQSLRPNFISISTQYASIETDIKKLQAAYPSLKPSTIYFTVGAFRTNGMTRDHQILIGSEFSLADKTTDVSEFPEWRQNFYHTQEPLKELGLLCTHEYIHTQQHDLVENLLSMCLYEGVAEFISCHVTGKPSASPAIAYGKANEKVVVKKYMEDLFTMSNDYNWLWGENRNEFKVRDLGYYIGYEMCERYYNQAKDKKFAIKELIELDYHNEKEVERIVNSTHLLPKPLEQLYEDNERQRPTVTAISPFKNGEETVSPGLTKITVTFSEPLLPHNTGIDFGPLGQDHCPKIGPERSFNAEATTWTFEADLKPNQHYQILISNNFRKENGVRLKPYLLDFKTRAN